MHFDATITLGNILSVAGYLGTILAVYTRIVERLARLETKVDALWNRQEREGG
jgi:hypothetical protein